MLDLLIKNASIITGEPVSVGIRHGKIAEISPTITTKALKEVDIRKQCYVSAGWIDGHVHCNSKMPLYYDDPDEVGVKKGVTTIIDAGSNGAATMADFYRQTQLANTNVYALANIAAPGIVAQNELADMHNIDKALVKEQFELFPDFVLGLKVRMSGSVIGDNGYQPLIKAKELQEELGNVPLMIHVGSQPPKLTKILEKLDRRDIMTHCFNGKENGIVDRRLQRIRQEAFDAYKRGVRFDVGHGTDSFSFETAVSARQAGLVPQTVSTDIYRRNREAGPVYDLATTMEKMLVIGYSLEEVVTMVTKSPAENFGLQGKGRLEVGCDADITIFKVDHKDKILVDSKGLQRRGTQVITPVAAVIGGEIYDI